MKYQIKGGDQNLERRDVERPVFQNFEIANIKIKIHESFDNFIFELYFSFLEIISTPKIFNNFLIFENIYFPNVKILKIS